MEFVKPLNWVQIIYVAMFMGIDANKYLMIKKVIDIKWKIRGTLTVVSSAIKILESNIFKGK